MARDIRSDDDFIEDDGDQDVDPDDPDLADQDDPDDFDETVPCPYCRKPVHEQAEICHHCGRYIVEADAPRGYPWWVWVGLILCLVAVLIWIF